MTPSDTSTPHALAPLRILSGLIISGFLMSLLGGLLPLWGYHIRPEYHIAANYFAAAGVGMIGGAAGARRLALKFRIHQLLAVGCFSAAVALLLLSVAEPPASLWFQLFALLLCGISAGVINTAIFESIATAYDAHPARITLTGGIFFGLGSILAALLLARDFEDTGATRLLAITAMVPAAAGVAYARLRITRPDVAQLQVSEATRELRSVLAVVFAALLFFQFCNEWSMAGWLPVFLIDRLGLSPAAGVQLLVFYWLALTVGRFVTSWLLNIFPHGKILGVAAFCALFGCVALLAASTTFGVVVGILFIGAGYSAIYPLVAEKIAGRFTYYHPGYFNGIFTLALVGGMLAPFVLGHLMAEYGLRMLPLASIFGSFAVFALVLLIWLGRKVSGH